LILLRGKATKSTKLLGFANAFSGGLFMGIALFHLMPESAESFEEFYNQTDPNSKWKRLPYTFFIAFGAYSLILLIEKVAFDSHSLTDHDHGGHEHGDHHTHKGKDDLAEHLLDGHKKSEADREAKNKEKEISLNTERKSTQNEATTFIYDHPLEEDMTLRPRQGSKVSRDSENRLAINKVYKMMLPKKSLEEELTKIKEKGYEEESDDEQHSEDDEDHTEETMKNVVSSKGKFASYLQARNICK
jgi:hypothetical protein